MNSILNDNVVLVLPAKSEYVSTARLTASSVSTRAGFNIDEIEDIKVAVSEVCNIILSRAEKNISQYRISFDISTDNIKITFTAENGTLDCFEQSIENEYGLYIMKALMDSVELCNENHSIVMTKKIGV
ncbi:ATP-binding protein [Ruminiclostridium josui]|uniref:ATP-binding protein n=1 Tax=Ruminiclostridium josui TaxID=1499 RepID=UPI000467DC53|nr:ATP-binding protein [Ruminiclostridium josui]